jgi:Zn-finger nucleic acid-binding protein
MLCPRDQATLEKHAGDGIEIDECPLCGGTWLDRGELEALEALHERDHDAGDVLLPAADPVDGAWDMAVRAEEPLLDCPVCGARMDRREYAWASQVVIDECPQGCGKWLDKGELEQVELFFERVHALAEEPPDLRRVWAAFLARIKVV